MCGRFSGSWLSAVNHPRRKSFPRTLVAISSLTVQSSNLYEAVLFFSLLQHTLRRYLGNIVVPNPMVVKRLVSIRVALKDVLL